MNKNRVIIADDHTLFRSSISKIVREFDHVEKVYEANNADDILTILEHQKGEVDLIFTDLRMPGLNSVEMIKIVKKDYPDIKIVVVSMLDNEQVIVQLLQLDIDGYLLKQDCTVERLKNTISEVMENGQSFDDRIIRLMHQSMQKRSLDYRKKKYYTGRELEVMDLMCQGKTTTEIGETLHISVRTVEVHKQNLLTKTNSRNSVELTLFAIKNGLIDLKVLLQDE